MSKTNFFVRWNMICLVHSLSGLQSYLEKQGVKIHSFIRLHKDKSIRCKILYTKSIQLSMNTKIYMLLLRYLKVSGCIALCYLILISLVFNVYDNCFNSCIVFCD